MNKTWFLVTNLFILWFLIVNITGLSLSISYSNQTICIERNQGDELNAQLGRISLINIIIIICLCVLFNIIELVVRQEKEESLPKEEKNEKVKWFRWSSSISLIALFILFLVASIINFIHTIQSLVVCQYESVYSLITSIYCLNTILLFILSILRSCSPIIYYCREKYYTK